MAPGPHSNPPAGRMSATGRTLAADRPQATRVQLSGGDPVNRPPGRISPRRLAGALVPADFGKPEEHAAPDSHWFETSTRVERPVVASTHMLARAGRQNAGRSFIFNAGRPGVLSDAGQEFRQQRGCNRAVLSSHPVKTRRCGRLSSSPVSIAASQAGVEDSLQDQRVVAALHECPAPADLQPNLRGETCR